MRGADHPTIAKLRQSDLDKAPQDARSLDVDELRRLCLEAGADDVGFVAVDRPELDDQREEIYGVLPGARTLISFVIRLNGATVRSPARSVANHEFHNGYDETAATARAIVRALAGQGVQAVNPSPGFPMEMDRFPGRVWTVSHKPVAEAAGLGVRGIHRNVIHPRFGSHILLGTVVTDASVAEWAEGHPLDYNPCVECKLCVAACPVGAISPAGRFDFSACITHNYRGFLGGFNEWAETLADAGSAAEYRARYDTSETTSMWQSLAFKPGYKAAYCVAVCPAGEDVLGPYLADKGGWRDRIVRPLTDKAERVYVLPGADAERHVARRFPNKTAKRVRGGLRSTSIGDFLYGMTLTFQPGRAKGVDRRYHFVFTGDERMEATVRIAGGEIEVTPGLLTGEPDATITADSRAWLAFVTRERRLLPLLLTRKLRVKGSLRAFAEFGRCFPG